MSECFHSLCNIVFFIWLLIKVLQIFDVFLVCAECFGAQSNLSCLVFLQCFSGWVVNVQRCVCVCVLISHLSQITPPAEIELNGLCKRATQSVHIKLYFFLSYSGYIIVLTYSFLSSFIHRQIILVSRTYNFLLMREQIKPIQCCECFVVNIIDN